MSVDNHKLVLILYKLHLDFRSFRNFVNKNMKPSLNLGCKFNHWCQIRLIEKIKVFEI